MFSVNTFLKQPVVKGILCHKINHKKTLWRKSASELYRPSDRCLSAKLVPTFADRGCHVVNSVLLRAFQKEFIAF
jgi:hypothetical protein